MKVREALKAAWQWLERTMADVRKGIIDGFDLLWYG